MMFRKYELNLKFTRSPKRSVNRTPLISVLKLFFLLNSFPWGAQYKNDPVKPLWTLKLGIALQWPEERGLSRKRGPPQGSIAQDYYMHCVMGPAVSRATSDNMQLYYCKCLTAKPAKICSNYGHSLIIYILTFLLVLLINYLTLQ